MHIDIYRYILIQANKLQPQWYHIIYTIVFQFVYTNIHASYQIETTH